MGPSGHPARIEALGAETPIPQGAKSEAAEARDPLTPVRREARKQLLHRPAAGLRGKEADISADPGGSLAAAAYLRFGEQSAEPPEGAASNGAAADPLEPVLRLHLQQSQGRCALSGPSATQAPPPPAPCAALG